ADEAEVASESDDALEFDAPEDDWQRFFIAGETPALRPEPPLGAVFDTDASPPADDAAAQDRQVTDREAAAAPSLEEETADTDTWKAFLQADAEAVVEQEVADAAADAEDDHAP